MTTEEFFAPTRAIKVMAVDRTEDPMNSLTVGDLKAVIKRAAMKLEESHKQHLEFREKFYAIMRGKRDSQ